MVSGLSEPSRNAVVRPDSKHVQIQTNRMHPPRKSESEYQYPRRF